MKITDVFAKDLFKGKTAFITGGGSGINLGIAKTFAMLGANIGLCGRKQEKLDTAAGELKALGAKVCGVAADVRDFAALEASMKQSEDALGPMDVLVCGAAGNFPCPAEVLSPNGFKSVIDIDLIGSFNSCRAAFPQLQKTRGSVIFISAGQAFLPYAMQCHVGAAKAGIDNLMKNLALEWGKYGIRCNSVAPGPIDGTEGVKRLLPEGCREKMIESIPLQRLGTVEDIGNLCAYLCCPLSTYVTGTVIVADGGQNLPGSGYMTHIMMSAMG
ncbi:MAG: SDR family oxidoreductase [Candidatus Hydrogenedentes bacterium]|nr:SDR family oxidoreductase [Candidatus Hydrogenedentota bacterium]